MENVNFMQSFNSELNINNENVNSEGLLINYDGENMDISGYQNNDNFYAQLSNKDIMNLLAITANPMSLDKRLKKDFSVKHKTRRHHKKHKKQKNTKKRYRTPTPYPKKK